MSQKRVSQFRGPRPQFKDEGLSAEKCKRAFALVDEVLAKVLTDEERALMLLTNIDVKAIASEIIEGPPLNDINPQVSLARVVIHDNVFGRCSAGELAGMAVNAVLEKVREGAI